MQGVYAHAHWLLYIVAPLLSSLRVHEAHDAPSPLDTRVAPPGLFEATPQSMLQTFVIAKQMFHGTEPSLTQQISVISSTITIGTAISAMGSAERSSQWRRVFTLFAMTQSTLRVWTLCGFVLAMQQTEGIEDRAAFTPFILTVVYVLCSLVACFVSSKLMVSKPAPRVDCPYPCRRYYDHHVACALRLQGYPLDPTKETFRKQTLMLSLLKFMVLPWMDMGGVGRLTNHIARGFENTYMFRFTLQTRVLKARHGMCFAPLW